jgi:hypothetical protein
MLSNDLPSERLLIYLAGKVRSARSWPAQALRDADIETIVVDLPPHVREQVQVA